MLSNFQTKAMALLKENASALLTAGGVVGTVATAVLTGRAAVKAHVVIETAEQQAAFEASRVADRRVEVEFSKVQKIKTTWTLFIPSVLAGGTTIGSIILANRMSAQKVAALAAAYSISNRELSEYKGKVEEKLGLKKAETIRDEVQQDRVNNHPIDSGVVIIGNGEVLCYDAYSDRYFKSSVEKIREAERTVQQEILTSNECSLGFFYDELKLPLIGVANDVGWNINRDCSVQISTVLAKGHEPCVAIQFADLPVFEYATTY